MFKNVMNFFMICVDLFWLFKCAPHLLPWRTFFHRLTQSTVGSVILYSRIDTSHLEAFFSFFALLSTTPPFHLIVDFFNYFFFLLGTVLLLLPMLSALLFFSCPLERHSHNREWNFRFFFFLHLVLLLALQRLSTPQPFGFSFLYCFGSILLLFRLDGLRWSSLRARLANRFISLWRASSLFSHPLCVDRRFDPSTCFSQHHCAAAAQPD